MTREQLEHAIRAACDIARDTEVYVFGSQAILGQYPQAPDALRQSIEADIAPKNVPDAVDLIDAMAGEGSWFHRAHGFYIHGLPIDSATLPSGWEKRAIAVRHPRSTRGNTGWCIEAHDLAASKLVAYRDKDRDFVRVLLVEDLISPDALRDRLAKLAIEEEIRSTLLRWIDRIVAELKK